AGAPWLLARVAAASRRVTAERLATASSDQLGLATTLVRRGLLRAAGPLARSTVRAYGPALVVAALHPRLRRRALVVLALGTAWRFRDQRPRPADVALSLVDDLAYGVGVAEGAWRHRSLASLTPRVVASSLTWRDVLGVGA
ncbi:MAG: hypothetical protein ACRDV0_00405, partial [Acidimicrobiales bacterium]